MCRTRPLGRRKYTCQPCGEKVTVYNSCGERHCPDCSGSIRADWLDRTAPRLVPGTAYLQVVFTVPAEIAELLRINPGNGYSLLMRTAWSALKSLLEQIGIRPAAIIILHTWNQQLGHHPHLHVLIPAGGVSLDGKRWICVDEHLALAPGASRKLGERFRTAVFRRLRRIHKRGRLMLPESLVHLADPSAFRKWLAPLAPKGFRVWVQPPPTSSTAPDVILKYLARYISGGPISDRRLISHNSGLVTFLARPGADAAPGTLDKNEQVPITLTEEEFVHRWCQHILPKGFVRVRYYGESSLRRYKAWIEKCKELLEWDEHPCLPSDKVPNETRPGDSVAEAPATKKTRRCPRCGRPMECIEFIPRPGWREILTGEHRPDWFT